MNQMIFKSLDFKSGGPIPRKFTCQGNNLMPRLVWKNPPVNTVSFVIIIDDPDAVKGTYTHFVLSNIPSTVRSIPPLLGKIHVPWKGPCPPDEKPHHYRFGLYALNTNVAFYPGETVSNDYFQLVYDDFIISESVFIGTYEGHTALLTT